MLIQKNKGLLMAQKKFQKKTKFSAWDLDNDGEITDEEISHAKEIQETETKLRKI